MGDAHYMSIIGLETSLILERCAMTATHREKKTCSGSEDPSERMTAVSHRSGENLIESFSYKKGDQEKKIPGVGWVLGDNGRHITKWSYCNGHCPNLPDKRGFQEK